MILLIILLILTVVSIGLTDKELRNNEMVEYPALVKIFLTYLLVLCIFFIIFRLTVYKALESASPGIQFISALFLIIVIIGGVRLIMKRVINKFTSCPNIKHKLDGLFISGLTFAVVVIKIMFDLLS